MRDISEARRRIENAYATPSSLASGLEIALSTKTAQSLFLAIQLAYLAMYCAAPYHLHALNSTIMPIVIGAALAGIPVRLFLIPAVALAHPDAGRKFNRILPVLVLLDGAWAASPLLISNVDIGLALAAVAGLAYLPFSQRTLIRRIYEV